MDENMESSSLGTIIDAVEVGGPTAWGNLELAPLAREGESSAAYLLAEDALAQNLLKIELASAGEDWTLSVASRSQWKALVVGGEELFCQGYSYIAAATALIGPGGPASLAVCKVEEKRPWRDGFSARCGAFSPPRLRGVTTACRARHDASHPRSCRQPGALGELFDGYVAQLAVGGKRRSIEALRLACAERLEPFLCELYCPDGAQGVMAFAGGHFIGMDLFDSPQTLDRLWHRLLAGYALDALATHGQRGGQEGVAAAMTVLGELASSAPSDSLAPGPDGGAWILGGGFVGALLTEGGRLVHLCAFPEPPLNCAKARERTV